MGEAATLDLEGLRQWVGRSEAAQDDITPRLEASFRATLDRPPGQPAIGDSATLGVHWCLAPPIVPMEALGDDGHPRRGGFLPPVPLPRRMWAGGELAFEAPLQVGDVVTRTSRIDDVVIKEGRSGTMCFVTVRHNWTTRARSRARGASGHRLSLREFGSFRVRSRYRSARSRRRPASASGPAIPCYCSATRP